MCTIIQALKLAMKLVIPKCVKIKGNYFTCIWLSLMSLRYKTCRRRQSFSSTKRTKNVQKMERHFRVHFKVFTPWCWRPEKHGSKGGLERRLDQSIQTVGQLWLVLAYALVFPLISITTSVMAIFFLICLWYIYMAIQWLILLIILKTMKNLT